MNLKRIGHQYTVIPRCDKYCTVMILSEHDNQDDALKAMFKALTEETDEIINTEVEKLNKQDIRAISAIEAMKNMTPDERERFLEERNRKFINPILNRNIEMLEEKKRQIQVNRTKKVFRHIKEKIHNWK